MPEPSSIPWRSASPWYSREAAPPAPAATPSDDGADVVVVGAGVVGLVTAALLSAQGVRCLVLDRHEVGGVVTRGSTAKLTALQGTTYQQIATHHGDRGSAAYAAASVAGVAGVRALVAEHEIDCTLVPATAATYATTEDGLAVVERELDAARRAGLDAVRSSQGDAELPDVLGAVELGDQAHLDPGALCRGLAASLGPRSSVRPGTAVTAIHEQDAGCTVHTDRGERLACAHVVLATLAPIDDPAQLAARCVPHRSYAIAAPHPDPPSGMYLSVEEPLRSVRPATIGGRPAVVVAGESHVVGDGPPSPDPWESLHVYATEMLGAGEATHRWSAHDLDPSDHAPFIGALSPGSQRRWVACGFRKWGVSTAWIAGDLIAAGIAGHERRSWADLFDPGRLRSSLTTDLAKGALRSGRHLARRIGGSPTTSSGRRAVCTHLGCSLEPNDAEDTWDCPCHGSRFEPDGTVISGPAARELSRSRRGARR